MTSSNPTGTKSGHATIQVVAILVGWVFLFVGVLGFIPGIVTDYDSLELAGHESEAELIGLFQVSILHNVVHVLFGVVGLLLARTVSGAKAFIVGGGAVYLALWIYGLAIDHESNANFVPLNDADNWLHFVLGVGMVVLGFALAPRRSAATA